MRNDRTKIILLFVAITVIAVTICACTPIKSNDPQVFVTVVLNEGKGVTANLFISDGKFVKPKVDPTRRGYAFEGWFFDEEFEQPAEYGFTIDKDISVYAKWRKVSSYAYFYLGSYTEELEVEISEEGTFKAPTVSRAGYNFAGWYADNLLTREANFDAKYYMDVRFYAKWDVITYTISYDTDGKGKVGVNSRLSYTVEDAVTLVAPTALTNGYGFLCWENEDGEAVHNITKGSVGDRAYKAKYLCYGNSITGVTGGRLTTTGAELTVPYSVTELDLTDVVTVSDRATFSVGADGGREVTLEEGLNVFDLHVTAEDESARLYELKIRRCADIDLTVSYYFPHIEKITRTIKQGETAPVLTEGLEYAGYLFDGWFNDAAAVSEAEATGSYDGDALALKFDFNTPVTSDLTLCAKYSLAEYLIKYFGGMGKIIEGSPFKYNVTTGAALHDAVAPDGYAFDGWFTDAAFTSKITEIAVGTTSDLTLYARFKLIKTANTLRDDFTDGQEIAFEEIAAYFGWAVFNRKASFTFVVTDADYDAVYEAVSGYVLPNNCKGSLHLGYVGSTYTVSGLEYIVPDRTDGDSAVTQVGNIPHIITGTARAEDYDGFKINSITDALAASDGEQLFEAVHNGYRPVPSDRAASLYNKAKAVLRSIVTDDMTDIEKMHAIYDYVTVSVIYDHALVGLQAEGLASAELIAYNGFHLEGVFDDGKAVCDGISKAMVLLARIEGIECVRVTGKARGGVNHAWNKVKIDGNWYVLDATNGDMTPGGADYELPYHKFFMITDEEMALTHEFEVGEYAADTEYDYYKAHTFMYDGEEYDFVIENDKDLAAALMWYFESGEDMTCADFRIEYLATTEGVMEAIQRVKAQYAIEIAENFKFVLPNNILIFIIKE